MMTHLFFLPSYAFLAGLHPTRKSNHQEKEEWSQQGTERNLLLPFPRVL